MIETLRAMKTLHELLRWGFEQTPKLEVVDVVIQDEYSHDLIAKLGDQASYYAFDTT